MCRQEENYVTSQSTVMGIQVYAQMLLQSRMELLVNVVPFVTKRGAVFGICRAKVYLGKRPWVFHASATML
jgi:hypothetical protein